MTGFKPFKSCKQSSIRHSRMLLAGIQIFAE
jgi:hypothetical protein